METPVIYFYSEQPRNVDVTVDFPEGSITEWYPQVTFGKPVGGGKVSNVRWPQVAIETGHSPSEQELANDGTANHYYAARETDSELVRVKTGDTKTEAEKFLFYRGVGSFTAPLTVKLDGSNAEKVLLTNTGNEALSHLFVLEVRGGKSRFQHVDKLASNETASIALNSNETFQPLAEVRPRLAGEIATALKSAGLYERESAAMMKTWGDFWFSEEGLRVLYVLPRKWTDGVLPLTFAPAPRALVRVMIGRAEVLTPQIEEALAVEVNRFISGDEAAKNQAIQNARGLGLGRFAEAALRRLFVTAARSQDFSRGSWELLTAVSKN
jgi:hypothetical protein